ncbi:MAG: hypothetical protein WC523_00810, partial [Patescibacteria group bacterium]
MAPAGRNGNNVLHASNISWFSFTPGFILRPSRVRFAGVVVVAGADGFMLRSHDISSGVRKA